MQLRRRTLLRGASVGLAVAVVGCLGDGGGDNDEYDGSCPPVSRFEAASMLSDVAGVDGFDLEAGADLIDRVAHHGGSTASGSYGLFAGPDGNPYRVTVARWNAEATAQSYAESFGVLSLQWRGEDVQLEAGRQARRESTTVTMRVLSADHRSSLETLYAGVPCFDEEHVVTTID